MNCDLHTHSTASDGALSPTALLERAVANGVDCLALTDHDSTDGVAELAEAASRASEWRGEWVAGVEISALCARLPIHVVGLWVDPDSPQLGALLERQRHVREQRAEAIAARLAAAGMVGALAGARQLAAAAVLSRPHFARWLVAEGHCRTVQQAFKRWLGRGKIGDVRCEWAALDTVIDVIQAAGGHAVLAHPEKYRLSRGKLRQLIGDFAAAGGDAIEIVSGPQERADTERLLQLAVASELAGSIGSDFHSPAQHWSDVGSAGRLPAAIQPVWDLPRRSVMVAP